MHIRRNAMLKVALVGSLAVIAACGPKQDPAASTSKPKSDPNGPIDQRRNDGSDAGTPDASAGAPKDEKPFAGSAAEATSMISAVVDKKQDEIATCVREFRARKKMAHERVAVSFGIDQEGRLLGVTSKGKEDAELKTCVQGILQNAPFPRSHAGVITVTKSYEEIIK